MNKRVLLYLAATTGLLVLFLYSIATSVHSTPITGRLDYNHVRGSEVVHGVPYTLNFEQQNALITYINAAEISTSRDLPKQRQVSPLQIIIYRFNLPDIVITPLTYIEDNLLFSTPEWNEGKPLLDRSQGELKHLLENSYDK